ncbi:hypothetical protein Dip510_001816 [Elusimicrobium posterum]|uniref:hypothetical protein n=1 Tax=Elusimicrobium posterum TaxID=3116653 RepID=UPI003C73D303
MKKTLVLALISILSITNLHAFSIKEGVKSVTSWVTSTVKDTTTGIKEGIDEGRKSGDSTDGAALINTKEDLNLYIKANAQKLEVYTEYEPEEGKKNYIVTVALTNDTDSPVRLMNLAELKSIVLIETDGFATPLTHPAKQGNNVTVLANSATRVKYYFNNVQGTPQYIRIYGENFKLPALSK